jgi:hypothetical protein
MTKVAKSPHHLGLSGKLAILYKSFCEHQEWLVDMTLQWNRLSHKNALLRQLKLTLLREVKRTHIMYCLPGLVLDL